MYLLGAVWVVATRVAGDVVVPKVLVMSTDGADQITFHNLHVIRVVEQFDALRTNRLDARNAELSTVAVVIGVVDTAVEQLEHDGHFGLFGQ